MQLDYAPRIWPSLRSTFDARLTRTSSSNRYLGRKWVQWQKGYATPLGKGLICHGRTVRGKHRFLLSSDHSNQNFNARDIRFICAENSPFVSTYVEIDKISQWIVRTHARKADTHYFKPCLIHVWLPIVSCLNTNRIAIPESWRLALTDRTGAWLLPLSPIDCALAKFLFMHQYFSTLCPSTHSIYGLFDYPRL